MSLPRPTPESLRGRIPLLAASYAVMTREGVDGREVLLQLRQGTGFMDGWWACGAAGHIEDAGSPAEALHREVEEELGVEVPAATPLTMVQRSTLAGVREQRADFFFHVTQWSGEPLLQEPDKAAELRWWPLAQLPERVVPHERPVLEGLRDGGLPPSSRWVTTSDSSSSPRWAPIAPSASTGACRGTCPRTSSTSRRSRWVA
uniref:NUDIX domain-containing protein n=1 Tax=Janibacter limosus TaxID=53458 RepID=A0AC61U1Y0_9MICO|nr:NUDIX domain-containing protein [Janibacter limosus]